MHTDHGIASTATAFSMPGVRSVICSAPQIPGGRIMEIGIIESSRRALRPRSAHPPSFFQGFHVLSGKIKTCTGGAGEVVAMMENTVEAEVKSTVSKSQVEQQQSRDVLWWIALGGLGRPSACLSA